MMKLFLAAAAAASIGAAIPASALAQDGPPPSADRHVEGHDIQDHVDGGAGGWSLDRREQWVAQRIQRASDHGWLSGNEDRRGRAELGAIGSEQARLLAQDGGTLSEPDRVYLAQRIDELNRTLRWQGHNPPPPWS